MFIYMYIYTYTHTPGAFYGLYYKYAHELYYASVFDRGGTRRADSSWLQFVGWSRF
jgi:hypothetical protein